MHYQLSSDERGHTTLAVVGSFGSRTVDSSNPNFEAMRDGVIDGTMDEETFVRLASPGQTISAKLAEVTERLRYVEGHILFDGDVVDNTLTRHMLTMLHEGDENWVGLARFMENLAANPSENARACLYNWVSRHGMVITDEGLLVGYKGVGSDGRSLHSGYGIVDGVVHTNDHLPHEVGSVVEFPRSRVDRSSVACSVGLHVGTYRYASGFGARLLTVLVNPRDVVNEFPDDPDLSWKFRTCRYVVKELAPEAPYTGTSRTWDEEDEEETSDEERCERCGDDEVHSDNLCHDCLVEDEDDDERCERCGGEVWDENLCHACYHSDEEGE